MNTVFLILYLWNAAGTSAQVSGGTGGPAVQITAVPSLAACEALGKAAKELIDANRPDKAPALYWRDDYGSHGPTFSSAPTVYRCVQTGPGEVQPKPQAQQPAKIEPPCIDKATQITGFLGTPGDAGCVDPRQRFTIEPDGHGHSWAICRCGQK